jgi:hypothetical protein
MARYLQSRADLGEAQVCVWKRTDFHTDYDFSDVSETMACFGRTDRLSFPMYEPLSLKAATQPDKKGDME